MFVRKLVLRLRYAQTIRDHGEHLLASEEECKDSRQASVPVDNWSWVCLICRCFWLAPGPPEYLLRVVFANLSRQNVLTLWRAHFICTLGLQLESLQYFYSFALIKPCCSTSNALCLIGVASLNCELSFVLLVDAFGTSLVEMDSGLYITVRVGTSNVTAALLVFHKESFTSPRSFWMVTKSVRILRSCSLLL